MVEFSWPIRVYYEDTDAGGIVYHASYVRFFERARTEFLRYFGVTQNALLTQQIGFVVRNMTIDFVRTARLDQQLTVVNRIIAQRKTAIVFEQIINDEENSLLCKAEVVVVCIDTLKVKPIAIPQSVTMAIKMTESTSGR